MNRMPPHTFLIDWVPSTSDPSTGAYLDAPVPAGSTLRDPQVGSPAVLIKPTGFGQDSDGYNYMTMDVTVP